MSAGISLLDGNISRHVQHHKYFFRFLKVLNSPYNLSGFTLIELLIVVLIVATLAVSVFVALNPAQRLKDSKDARRSQDVHSILDAIQTYVIDNGGRYPTGLSAGMTEIQISGAASASGCAITNSFCTIASNACVDLGTPLSRYLETMPIDPSGGTTWTNLKTGYSVQIASSGIITVKACGTEGATLIQASK